jgi:hypothetical protein
VSNEPHFTDLQGNVLNFADLQGNILRGYGRSRVRHVVLDDADPAG